MFRSEAFSVEEEEEEEARGSNFLRFDMHGRAAKVMLHTGGNESNQHCLGRSLGEVTSVRFGPLFVFFGIVATFVSLSLGAPHNIGTAVSSRTAVCHPPFRANISQRTAMYMRKGRRRQ